MKVTVITMYRSHDAETFVQVVEGELSHEQKVQWRRNHKCDEYDPDPSDDGPNNMFFVTLDVLPNDVYAHLINIDG